MKILIIHTWGIGDLVMFTPALRLLRNNFPNAVIDVLITDKPVSAEVLQEGQTVNKIIKFSWKEKGFREKVKLILNLRKEKYDWTIVTSWTNPLKGGILSWLIGAKKRVGTYKKYKSPFYTHSIAGKESRPRRQTNLDLVKALGILSQDTPPAFFEFGQEATEFAKDFINKIGNAPCGKILIGFHPGAEKVHRYLLWPKEYFIELGKKIIQAHENAFIIIFSGPGEKDICQEIVKGIKENAFLAEGLSLKQVAALIDSCNIFVASDSGLGQIASATRTNLISIFGPSQAQLFAASGPKVKVLEGKCRHPYDENKIHNCLKQITPDIVLDEINNFLK